MAQKVVMKTEKKKLTLKEIETFLKVNKEYGIPMTDTVEVSSASGEVVFSKVLPLKVRTVNGAKVVLRHKTKKQQRVKKQIDTHNAKKVEDKPGHVPPEGKKNSPKQKKIKCPDCNTRKLVVKVAGVQGIKPHVSHGEPCPGSGKQVIGNKVKGEVNV